MLPLRAQVDQEAMAMKKSSPFPKFPAKPSHCLVSYPEHSLVGMRELLCCRDAVGVLYSHWYWFLFYLNVKYKYLIIS